MSGKNMEKTNLERELGFKTAPLDTEEEQTLTQTITLMKQYTTPLPTDSDTSRLLSRLQAHIPAKPVRRFRTEMQQQAHPRLGLLPLIAPQLRILDWPFWLVSALIVVMGLVLSYSNADLLPLLAAAPLVITLGIAYAFRSTDERVLELELSCPVAWQQLALARMLLILVYDVVLLLAASLVAYRLKLSVSLLPLIASWLAPLLLWAGVSLYASLRYGNIISILVSLAAWGFELLFPMRRLNLFAGVFTYSAMLIRLGVIFAGLALLTYTLGLYIKNSAWAARSMRNEA